MPLSSVAPNSDDAPSETTGGRRSQRGFRGHRQRGATIVEFALFFLLFFVVAVALMELGRGVWTYTTIAHAARQGARYALIHGELNPIAADGKSIEDVVKANAVGLQPSDIQVSTNFEQWDSANGTWLVGPAYNTRGNVVEVEVRYPFRLVTGPLILAQDTIQMASTTRVVIAN